jgi:hypothetical protein
MEPRVHELWRIEYVSRAYTDQTGQNQSGYLVYEQILATDTSEHFDVNDGYKVYPDLGTIATAPDGRRFRLWSETVSYTGGTNVIPDTKEPGDRGYWRTAPHSVAGYVTPLGQPIRFLLVVPVPLAAPEPAGPEV